MFRKLLAMMLFLALLFCVACSNDTLQNTQPITTEQPSETESIIQTTESTETTTEPEPTETEEPTQEPTEEVFAPIDPDSPVIEAYTAESTTDFYTCSLPQIQCESSYAQAINQEITEMYYGGFEDDAWWGGTKSFHYYVNGDILTLLIYHYDTENPSDYDADLRHSIYNLHMSDGSKVTADEILEFAGVSKEDFRARVRQILGNAYLHNGLPDAAWEAILADPETSVNNYNFVQFVATVSEENLDLAEPFFTDGGKLHFMGRKYHIAGGFEFSTPLFEYSASFEASPFYEAMIALVP